MIPSQRRLNVEMFAAARDDDLQRMERALLQGADINCRQKNGEGLMDNAIDNDSLAVVHFLLERPDFKASGLHSACLSNKPWIVEALILKGADPFAPNEKEVRPLNTLYGDRKIDLEIAQILLARASTELLAFTPQNIYGEVWHFIDGKKREVASELEIMLLVSIPVRDLVRTIVSLLLF